MLANKEEILDNLYESIINELEKRNNARIEDMIRRSTEIYARQCILRLFDIPLTVEQVAKLMDVKEDTVYKWISRGVINSTKVHGRHFISLRDLNRDLLN